jgi:alpha-L-rhamnosidase
VSSLRPLVSLLAIGTVLFTGTTTIAVAGSRPFVVRDLRSAHQDRPLGTDDIAKRTTSPSLGFQVRAGLTALGETWDGGSGQSQNHFMLGAMDAWLLTRLTGIEQTADSTGFRRLLIDPAVVGDLTSASGSYQSTYGRVSTSWKKDDREYRLDVTVPAGATAEVHVPVFRDEHGRFHRPTGGRLVRIDGDDAIFEVGSGSWTFRSHA